MSTYRWMRASDQDRAGAAALLGDAFAAGRLTRDELDKRCGAASAASTWGELDDLTADLPIVGAAVSPPSGTVAPRRGRQLDNQRPFRPLPFWPLLTSALVLGAILGSLAQSAVAWTAAVLIPLALLLPLALGSARRRGRR
jgi:Domain of unknown function (DUF1707)